MHIVRRNSLLHQVVAMVAVFAAASLAAAPARGAVTREVCASGCAYSRIQAAIDASAGGDTVLVKDGHYDERITFSGKAITVRSVNGPETTVIDGGGGGTVVSLTNGEGAGSVLSGFGITGGSSAAGGGIYVWGGSATFQNCKVFGNASSVDGGGVWTGAGSPTFDGCTFKGNYAGRNGGRGVRGERFPVLHILRLRRQRCRRQRWRAGRRHQRRVA